MFHIESSAGSQAQAHSESLAQGQQDQCQPLKSVIIFGEQPHPQQPFITQLSTPSYNSSRYGCCPILFATDSSINKAYAISNRRYH